MKKNYLTLMLILVATTICDAQKIETQKVFGGYKFTQSGKPMTMRNLVETMEVNTQAFELIKKAQSSNTLVSILSFTGGGLIGWPLGTAVGGGDANWALAGIGAGLVAIAIPISSGVNKNAKQAVELYNASLNQTSYFKPKTEFEVIANSDGIGLSLKF